MTGIETEDLTVEEFCDRHGSPGHLRKLVFENYSSMREAWENLPDSHLTWVALQPGVLTDSDLRSFAENCIILYSERIAEAYSEECCKTCGAIRNSIIEAGRSSSKELAKAQGWAELWGMVWNATGRSAASLAEKAKRAAWLRANCKPNFKKGSEGE